MELLYYNGLLSLPFLLILMILSGEVWNREYSRVAGPLCLTCWSPDRPRPPASFFDTRSSRGMGVGAWLHVGIPSAAGVLQHHGLPPQL